MRRSERREERACIAARSRRIDQRLPQPHGAVHGLLVAAHPGPAVAVTTIAALLAVAADRPAHSVALVALAVFTGQLTVGWVNDLADRGRDRAVGRVDKPLATGEVTTAQVALALAVVALACVVLSLAAGWRSGLVHLVLGLGSAHAYNLLLKSTALSWAPYAVAFGTLPAVASLAGPDPSWPRWWLATAGAALGVGAHVLNALPDLADDLDQGVNGLPHRLGATVSRVVAAVLLVAASLVAAIGPDGRPATWVWVALVAVLVLAAVALRGSGVVPFRAAIAIALIDVALLVGTG